MKIAFFEILPGEKKFLEEKLKGQELKFFEGTISETGLEELSDFEVISVFIYSRLSAEVMAKFPKLKLVTTRSMGFDHIDLDYAAGHGISVCSVPSYGERTVAEHAFGLILGLSRKLFSAYDLTEKAKFDYHGLTGFDLKGKMLGVIGGGRIGLNVVKIGRLGFEMEVLVYDAFPRPELAAEYGFKYVPLEELLGKSDVISLHAPYLPATHHLINADNIKLIKRGAILVNTARGALVDTKALLTALDEGILAGAGLDVLEEENFITEEKELIHGANTDKFNLQAIVENHMLIARNDVIITPHIAFNSVEALEKILATTAENILAFQEGKPINLVVRKK